MNDQRTTVYFHIGTNKTGTTHLQKVFRMNKKSLRRAGVLYPDFHIKTPVNSDRNGYVFEKKMEELRPGTEKECLDQLLKHVTSGKYQTIIISDEDLYFERSTRPDFFRDLQVLLEEHGALLKLIVYLRRQDEYMLSMWQHKIKRHNESRDLDTFLHKKTKFYQANYNRFLRDCFAKQIGAQNIIVRKYDMNSFPKKNGIVGDFLGAIGVNPELDLKMPHSKQNESLKGICLEAKRRLNASHVADDKEFFEQEALLQIQHMILDRDKTHPGTVFTKTQREEYLARFEKPNKRLCKSFSGWGDGPLFDPVEDDIPDCNAEYSEQEITDIFARIMTQNIEHINRLRNRTTFRKRFRNAIRLRFSNLFL